MRREECCNILNCLDVTHKCDRQTDWQTLR